MATQEIMEDIASKLEIIKITLQELLEVSKTANSGIVSNFSQLANIISTIPHQLIENHNVDIDLPEDAFHPHPSSTAQNANRIKKLIGRIWKQTLNQRKQNFWNGFKFARISDIYADWLSRDAPILPRKFRPVHIPGEHMEDSEIRKENAIQNVRSEIRILRNKSQRANDLYRKADSEMMRILRDKCDGEVLEKLEKMWQEACLKEEEISQGIWMKKKTWYDNYPDQHGSEMFVKIKERAENKGIPDASQKRLFSTVVKTASNSAERRNNTYRRSNRIEQGTVADREIHHRSTIHYNNHNNDGYLPRRSQRLRGNGGRKSNGRMSFLGQARCKTDGGGNTNTANLSESSDETLLKHV